MKLIGLPLQDAEARLSKEGADWKVVAYRSARPYEDANSTRVVRARLTDGIYELTVCEFKTQV